MGGAQSRAAGAAEEVLGVWPGSLPEEVFQACQSGRRPRGGPRTRWRHYTSQLAGECPQDQDARGVSGLDEQILQILNLCSPKNLVFQTKSWLYFPPKMGHGTMSQASSDVRHYKSIMAVLLMAARPHQRC